MTMQTVILHGVPYRMRADMIPYYVEWVEKDKRAEEIQEAHDEGYKASNTDAQDYDL